MPNINLLQAITSATSSTYLIATSEGVARRINFAGISSQIEQNFTTGVRTDQNLYTTSTVRFVGLDIRTTATSVQSAEVPNSIGYSFDYYHRNGTAIKQFDALGSVNWGGFDGEKLLSADRKTPSVQLSAFAIEDFETVNGITTNAGAGWSIAYQPPGIRSSLFSRQRIMSGQWSTPAGLFNQAGNGLPPIAALVIGTQGPTTATNTPTLINSAGDETYKGYGATQILMYHTQVVQNGVPLEDVSYFTGSITGDRLTVESINTSSIIGVSGIISPGQTIETVSLSTSTKIAYNTEIVQQITGVPGSTGTYLVSIPQEVVSSPMKGGPDNETLSPTNRYVFNSSRRSSVVGRRNALKLGDSIGELVFLGEDRDNSKLYTHGYTAKIRVEATQDFTTSSHGSSIAFLTTPIDTLNSIPTVTASLSLGYSSYHSRVHAFYDYGNPVTPALNLGGWDSELKLYEGALKIDPNGTYNPNAPKSTGARFYDGNFIVYRDGSIRFPDGTIQTTAYASGVESAIPTVLTDFTDVTITSPVSGQTLKYIGNQWVNTGAFRVVNIPTNSAAPGIPGDIAYTPTFIYICVAPNTWRRVNASTF
jgi:hypothetical protein